MARKSSKKTKAPATGSSNPVLLLYWNGKEDLDAATLKYWEEWLSAEELKRLHSMESEARKREFLVGRAIVRSSLAVVLECEPSEVPLLGEAHLPKAGTSMESGSFVGLHLPSEFGLCLGIAYSGGEIVFAVGEGRRLGVDIESPSLQRDRAKLADRFFTSDEKFALKELKTERDREDAFRMIWTAKESCLKSLGLGASGLPNNLQVLFDLKKSLLEAKATETDWQRGIPLLPISKARFIPTVERKEDWWIYWVKLPTSWACVSLQPVSSDDVPPPLMIESWGGA